MEKTLAMTKHEFLELEEGRKQGQEKLNQVSQRSRRN